MGSRRLLGSVAQGIANTFASRNNDVDGLWAPGLILHQLGADESSLTIDLIDGSTQPPLEPGRLSSVGPAYARYVVWSAARHGVPDGALRTATLTLTVGRATSVASWISGYVDHPFRVEVLLQDDRGHQYRGSAVSHCLDPTGPASGLIRRSLVTDVPRVLGRL